MLYLKEGGKRKLCNKRLLSARLCPSAFQESQVAALRAELAGAGSHSLGTQREGKGQSKKVSIGKTKQRRQARSDRVHTDLPGCWSTGECSSLAEACSLNPKSMAQVTLALSPAQP